MLINDPLSNNIEKKATRDGYGQALADLGEKNSKLVVLDADLSNSTKTSTFAKKYPERFFNFGVAEQNMLGHAAGLASTGLIPATSSFAMFATGRAWEVLRNSIAYPKLNVKIAGTHAGITLGEDGASHQIIEDIAITRCIPEMTVLVPADYWQAYNAVFAAVEKNGPVYIRLGRPGIDMIYDKETPFEIGKANIIQEGEKIAFFSTGIMVSESWKAARLLEQKNGIRPWVVDFHTIKPIDIETIINISKKVEKIYTFEEHNIHGGFGSAVSEILSENNPVKLKRIGILDSFGQSGKINELMDYYGLSSKKLFEKVVSEK
ncbi:MAG: transketolase family protein [Spirochaetia bacterium]|nr:transketolase family protein [Spirochaetia bacterium]